MMGERKVPECDIFKTLQPKGLRLLDVIVKDVTEEPFERLISKGLAVGARGRSRVLRMIEQACQPPKKREATIDA